MIRRDMRKPCRSGATMVEFAFVGSLALLVLFGIFEYARYVAVLQVTHNAAREGARFAIVHTGDGTTEQDVIDEVNRRMGSRQKELDGYQVEILAVDPNTGNQKPGSQWNDAAFGEAIAVRITGQYKPLLPEFLFTAEIIDIDISHMMNSEAN